MKKNDFDDSCNKHNYKSNEFLKEGYLGIDVGVTSTNVVLIDENGVLQNYRYVKTYGDPLSATKKALESIKSDYDNLKIKSMYTTCSGRFFISPKLGFDGEINEITTQAKAAAYFDDVDTVLEIGGQDSKFIKIKDGVVVNFEMNKICTAGTGSFLKEQSENLEISITEFSDFALKSENPLELGDRCTVFIDRSIKKAISKNEKLEDIFAGLTYSVVKNYLNRVVDFHTLGNKIFLQGGIAYNQSVVNAFRIITGKEIIVPKYFSVTGAYGVALFAKENYQNKNIIKKEKVNSTDLIYQQFFLKDIDPVLDPKKKTVGIPRALFLYKLFPVFNKFFHVLGFNVVLSNETTRETVKKAQNNITEETCSPVKLVNGHVQELIEKNIDYLFLPSIFTMKHAGSYVRRDYACQYMQSLSKMICTNIDFEKHKIKLLAPTISFQS